VIEAAEDLAAEGFYEEAADLLVDLLVASEEDTLGEPEALPDMTLEDTVPERPVEWRVAAGGDYYYYEDIDSSDTLLQYFAENEAYYVGEVSVGLEWRPDEAPGSLLASALHVSNTAIDGEVVAELENADRTMSLEVALRGEKHVRSEFGDSSDNVGIRIAADPSSGPSESPVVVSLPLEGEIENYRYSRPGYGDCRSVRLSPTVTLNFPGFGRSLDLGGDFERAVYDSVDRYRDLWRYGPSASTRLWFDYVSLSADLSYVWERYPGSDGAVFPERQQVLEVSADLSVVPLPWLEARLAGDFTHSVSEYTYGRVVDTVRTYRLPTPAASVTPQIVFSPGVLGSMSVGFTYEMSHAPLEDVEGMPMYIDDWYDAYEPSVGAGLSSEKVFVDGSVSFRMEDVREVGVPLDSAAAAEAYTYNFSEDSRSARVSLSASVSITTWLSANLYGDYEYQMFRPFGSGRSAHNRSLTVSLEATF
jgi:hypothetical protein